MLPKRIYTVGLFAFISYSASNDGSEPFQRNVQRRATLSPKKHDGVG